MRRSGDERLRRSTSPMHDEITLSSRRVAPLPPFCRLPRRRVLRVDSDHATAQDEDPNQPWGPTPPPLSEPRENPPLPAFARWTNGGESRHPSIRPPKRDKSKRAGAGSGPWTWLIPTRLRAGASLTVGAYRCPP